MDVCNEVSEYFSLQTKPHNLMDENLLTIGMPLTLKANQLTNPSLSAPSKNSGGCPISPIIKIVLCSSPSRYV
ncbi:hypothetical protein OUZ56_007186 [Daphnia magna]|uniref:Uncharacterized protein n=1 Tax=Daphnia magna TaxID=35525 RepID=A0ABQ9YXV4_9CRUS|nr:hypothetical protein OUZ56_007186 [Daphnia magna]